MTWPTTPINTTNLDAGSDQPALARADLKSMADAVNAMIDYGDPYDPASPVPIPTAMLTGFFPDPTYSVNASTRRTITNLDWYEIYDLIGISTTNDYFITVPQGKYIFEMNLAVTTTQTGGFIELSKRTTGDIYYQQPVRDIGGVYTTVYPASSIVVLGASTIIDLIFSNENPSNSSTFSILNNGSSGSSTDANAFILKITKVA